MNAQLPLSAKCGRTICLPDRLFKAASGLSTTEALELLAPEVVSNLLIYYEKAAFYFFVENSPSSLFKTSSGS